MRTLVEKGVNRIGMVHTMSHRDQDHHLREWRCGDRYPGQGHEPGSFDRTVSEAGFHRGIGRVRLSIHLMVLNGAAVLERMLCPLRGIADEICYVDTGSSDGTPDLINRLAGSYGMVSRGIAISSLSSSALYFLDTASSFQRPVPGPYTGLPLMRNWSAVRNMGLELCTGEYVMKLDADDEVLQPENVLPALARLDAQPEIDFLACSYEVADGRGDVDHVELYTRLWRNKPKIRFREVCHENVDWCRKHDVPNWLAVPSGLAFRDHHDSPGRGTRLAHRNLKVLLREYEHLETVGGRPSAHLVMYLAQETARVLPDLAQEALAWMATLVDELDRAEAAWYHAVRGEQLEASGDVDAALAAYSLAAQGGFDRSALLHARLLHRLGRDGWCEALATAIGRNLGRFYPRGASLPEIAAAEKIFVKERQ
jgi:hypothetical protein